ncbi:MAG: Dickkopf N-terminal cysteine-rich domain-containing protein [Myxococcota bacterium]
MGANSDNGCLGNSGGGGGPGFGQEGECSAAIDCEKFLPDVDCVGTWDCTNTVCSFECSGTTGCTSDAECPGGQCVNAECVSVQPPACTSNADCGSTTVCQEGICVPVINPPACVTSKDCALDQSCVAGICISLECTTDADCGPDEACKGNTCVPVANPVQCQSDKDCKAGSTCQCTQDPNCPACDVCFFQCVPTKPAPCIETGCSGEVCSSETLFTPCVYEAWYECLALTKCGNFAADGSCGWQKNEAFEQCLKDHAGPKDSCLTDSECGEGKYCATGICPGAPCTPDYCPPCYGTCEEIVPSKVCYGDQDCGAGTHCSVSDGVCMPPPGCKPGMACPAVCTGYCVEDGPTGCSDDSDCGKGEYCGCSWDFAGAPDADPAGAAPPCFLQCLPIEEPPVSCNDDSDCGKGEYCGCSWDFAGAPEAPGDAAFPCFLQCMPIEEPPPTCTSDADCGKGEYCGCGPMPFTPNALIACNLQCLPIEEPPVDCQTDSQCGPGQICQVACPDCFCPFEGDPADPNFAPFPCDCGPCVGTCVDAPPEPCSTDADCGKGEYCGCGPFPAGTPATALIACWQQCLPIEEPPVECSDDSECGPGQQCLLACPSCNCPVDPTDPNADPLPCDCGPCFGYCEDLPPQPCTSDNDCGKGEICGCGPWGGADPAGKIACFPQCIPDPAPTSCWQDSDCANGQVCNTIDYCNAPPGCGPDDACDAVCYGQCVDPAPAFCQSDADCKKGYACECGPIVFSPTALIACLPQCVPVEPVTGQCLSDQECGPNAHCNTTDYCLTPPWCTAGMPCPAVCYGLCEAGPGEGTCSTTMPCPAGQQCDIEVCEGCACVPGEDCSCTDTMQCYGTCSDAGPAYDCGADSDCKPGYYCAVQVCSGCACPAGEPDCDCAIEPSCKGYCKVATPQPTYCWDAMDCPAGQVCQLDAAQKPAAIPCTPEDCGDPLPPPPAGICVDAPKGECQATGCSGQICASEPMASTCEWQPWYACYKLAKCGAFGADGACSWSENPEFIACMKDFGTKAQ